MYTRQISGINFCNTITKTYSVPECRTVYVTVTRPYRHSFKLSVPIYENIDVAIAQYLNWYKPQRCIQVRAVEYNYSIA